MLVDICVKYFSWSNQEEEAHIDLFKLRAKLSDDVESFDSNVECNVIWKGRTWCSVNEIIAGSNHDDEKKKLTLFEEEKSERSFTIFFSYSQSMLDIEHVFHRNSLRLLAH